MKNSISLKKHSIIMLPAEKSRLYLSGVLDNQTLKYDNYKIGSGEAMFSIDPQQLYVLSNDKIEDGDWYVGGISGIDKYSLHKRGKYELHIPEICKKVIATTDEELLEHSLTREVNGFSGHIPIPNFQKSFITDFCNEYNNKVAIKEINIECIVTKERYNHQYKLPSSANSYPSFGYEEKIKTVKKLNITEDNTVVAHIISTEQIICAANWYKELPTPVYKPKNIEKGIVFCGHNHLMCLHQMIAITGKRQAEAGPEEQVFITNTNRFVSREEAAKIAISSGQIKKLNYSSKELYSEDLFRP